MYIEDYINCIQTTKEFAMKEDYYGANPHSITYTLRKGAELFVYADRALARNEDWTPDPTNASKGMRVLSIAYFADRPDFEFQYLNKRVQILSWINGNVPK